MTHRRTWLPIAGVVAFVAVVVALVALGRSDVEVLGLTVAVPAGPEATEEIDLDAALYLPGDASAQDPRPAVLLAHGFLGDRTGGDQRARDLADDGYVVLAWSARGFGASQGEVGLADPDAEIADVSRLVDVLADRPEVLLDGPGDPRVAIVGASYGAGTALLASTQEPRLDAVVAAAGWHSLARSLAPNGVSAPGDVAPGVLKVGWTSLLFTANALPADLLAASGEDGSEVPASSPGDLDPCGRFTAEICALYLEIARDGVLSDAARSVLEARSPAGRSAQTNAPTLLLQGQDDTLFDLTESRRNAESIAATGTPVRLRWVVGGHEVIGGAGTEESRAEVDAWLERWLRDGAGAGGDGADGADGAGADGVGDLVPFTWTDRAADAPRDRDSLPMGAGGAGADGALVFELGADGTLQHRAAADPDGAQRRVTLSSPPGGQPAALSALPGAGALVGFLPATDIPGQHLASTSAPMQEDVTLLGAPTMTLEVLAAEGDTDDAADPAPFTGDGGEVRVFVKLTDVAANGTSTLIHQAVTPVRATALPARLEIDLPDLAHRLRADHRLRVTIATTDQAFANRVDGASTPLLLGAGAASLRLPTVSSVPAGGSGPIVAGVAFGVLALAVLLVAIRRRDAADRSVATSVSTTERPGHDTAAPAADGVAVEVGEPPPIAIRGLTKRYRDGHLAVDGFDLTVEHGQVMGLLGPNGAGKTSSVRMLLGLSTPTAGRIRIFGHDMRPGHPVLERVGALVEGPGFVPELSGIDNLELYWRAGRRPLDEADLPWALEVAALGDAIRKPVRTYSHGMKQRLAIAQALLGRPELLVLDEPTDGLDPEQIRAMRELLARLGDEGHTVLVSSHLLSEVEQMCTHVAVVQRGRLLASGSIAELVGAGRTVVVDTDDRARARAVLGRHLGDEAIEPSGAGLAVTLGERDPSELVTWLVAEGLRIHALTPRGKLEDAFLSLTGAPAADTLSDDLADDPGGGG